jgi:hypothetical protein
MQKHNACLPLPSIAYVALPLRCYLTLRGASPGSTGSQPRRQASYAVLQGATGVPVAAALLLLLQQPAASSQGPALLPAEADAGHCYS